MSDKIRQWFLENGYDSNYREESVSGGCINAVSRIYLGDGQTFILKQNQAAAENLFAAEAAGLSALRGANALRVPEVICATSEFLLLEDLGQGRPGEEYWQRLGIGMAKLHSHQQPLFGFTMDNYCGSTAQINTTAEDGFEFFDDVADHVVQVGGSRDEDFLREDLPGDAHDQQKRERVSHHAVRLFPDHHHLSRLDQGRGDDAGPQPEFFGGAFRDDRSDCLVADVNLDLRKETLVPHVGHPATQPVAPADRGHPPSTPSTRIRRW